MKRVAVLIDGGHLRVIVRKNTNNTYNPDYIEKVAHACALADEEIFRIFYYDCAPYAGSSTLPVSGNQHQFNGNGSWLKELATRNLFAVRYGVLKFRGYKLKNVPVGPAPLTDNDFSPVFEQKGVDMRIGLDIATFSSTNAVDRIVLITNDTDCIPAMKHGRIAGLQIVLMEFPGQSVSKELLHHTDYHRPLTAWPI